MWIGWYLIKNWICEDLEIVWVSLKGMMYGFENRRYMSRNVWYIVETCGCDRDIPYVHWICDMPKRRYLDSIGILESHRWRYAGGESWYRFI